VLRLSGTDIRGRPTEREYKVRTGVLHPRWAETHETPAFADRVPPREVRRKVASLIDRNVWRAARRGVPPEVGRERRLTDRAPSRRKVPGRILTAIERVDELAEDHPHQVRAAGCAGEDDWVAVGTLGDGDTDPVG